MSSPPAEEKAVSRSTILSLYLPAIVLALGEGIAAPALPGYAKSFDVTFSTAALIVIVQPWGSVFATFPTGYMIDRVGRKPVLLMGPILTATAAFMTVLAPSFALLLVCRFFDGAATQMWQQSRLAMIADSGGSRERGKMITWMASMSRVGQLGAPALGGLVAGIDLRAPFALQGCLVLLCVIPSFFIVKETVSVDVRRAMKTDGDWGFVRAELLKPHMLWFLLAQVFANLTRGNLQAIMTLYMGFSYGRSPQSLGFIASGTSLLTIPIGFITGTVMDRYGRKKTVVPGFLLLSGAAALCAFTAINHSPFGLFLFGYYALSMGQSITGGNMQVLGSDLAPARARGRFIGIWRLLAALGGATSPTMFSVMATIGYAASFSFIGTCALIVASIIAFKVRETVSVRHREPPPGPPDAAPTGASPPVEPVLAAAVIEGTATNGAAEANGGADGRASEEPRTPTGV